MPTLRNRRVGPALVLPSLGHWARRPEPWLAVLLLAGVLFVVDAVRPPQSQVSVHIFAASVDGYHRFAHPLTGRFIHCRFSPTCSQYSVQAVRKYGIVKGGWMSLRRIASCRPSVPMGTVDRVP